MKIFFALCLFIIVNVQAQGQTTPLAFTTIGTGSDDFLRPGGGANEWTGNQYSNQIPTVGVNSTAQDRYWRFTWLDFQAATVAAGSYNFSVFDSKIQESITKGQSFSFGIMQQCGGCDANQQINDGGNKRQYPDYLHAQMQAESPQDFTSGGEWFPNYNSPSYLTAWKNLNVALNAHILSGSFNGINYRDIIGQIDVRGYGDFGEWTNNVFNVGNITVASGDSIISYVVHSFNTFKCVNMIAAFDGQQLTSNTNVPAGIGYYALTTSNAAGRLGWRRDSWGQTDSYLSSWTDANNTTFSGLRFKDSIMTRGLYEPIVGEPQDGGSAGNFPSLDAQIKLYLVQSFGNGNFNNGTNATIAANFRTASKDAGYRMVVLSSGSNMTTSPQPGGTCNISLNWQNVNGIPPHQDFRIVYEWRVAGGTTVLQRDTAVFNLNGFYNKTGAVDNENFTMRTVPAGTADLYMKVIQPRGYKKTMPLFITGVKSDGAYLLRASIPIAASGPVANAGPNQNILISSANLTASGSVAATSWNWTQLSGPNTAGITTPSAVNTSVTGLITGTYVFQVCINGGPCSGQLISTVTIVVNAPGVSANAGSNQTITLPTSTVSLNGSLSTGFTSQAWSNISGPNVPTITSPGSINTTVTGLIQGTYVFRLTINGGASTSDVTVTVLGAAAAVANAGASQTITLPTAAVTLNGNNSTGTITSYAWTLVSGPAGSSFSSPGTVSTLFSGLVQGVYVVRLTLNGGSSDTLQVTVNPAVPPSVSTATIFTTQTPNGAVENDNLALELGVKFRSTQAGYITGIRFYKSLGNNGTHTGQLYTSTGTLMASAVFTSESGTGWQTVQIIPAVPILANTTYIAAYFSPNGTYTSTVNYFTTAVVTSPLTALADGTDGVNGVYKYSATPVKPDTGYQKSNYWVDVVFSLINPGGTPISKFRSIYFQHIPRP